MGAVKPAVIADLEDEDYFEEFDLDMPQKEEKMADETEEVDETYGEAEKWDDDDIEEDFSVILKKELKLEDTDDFDIDVIVRQEIETREAKRLKKKERRQALALKELELLRLDKTLQQRRKIYTTYTLDPAASVESKKLETPKKAASKDVQSYFEALESDLPAGKVDKDEFAEELKPILLKNQNITLAQLRDNLMEKEKELKRRQKLLDNEEARFKKNRRDQAAKLLPEDASETDIKAKEEEETVKVMAARQTKRRRASLVFAQEKAAGMGEAKKEDMDKLVLQAAQEVAAAETMEEATLLGAEPERPSTAASKKCLPYKPASGDEIDAAVGQELTAKKFDCGIKLLGKVKATSKSAKRKTANTREYLLESGEVIRIKVVHKVVLANDVQATSQWLPLVEFLQQKLGR